MVASSEPDGRTLLWSYPGPLTTAPLIYENLDYDPTKSVAPVATIFSSPCLLEVNAAVPAKSVQEFVTYLKANPGKLAATHRPILYALHLTANPVELAQACR